LSGGRRRPPGAPRSASSRRSRWRPIRSSIEDAYFPWIGALHSLLDHLVDRDEDARAAQRNLLDYYASPAEAAARMQTLSQRAAHAAHGLPRARQHAILLAAMTAYYLSDPGAATPDAAPIAHSVGTAIGGLTGPALLVFRTRRLASALSDAAARGRALRPRAALHDRDAHLALRLQR
jgi:hypothetical protein